ncbi:MAG: hypothetical protein O2985_11395, partial [Proteobacteria bacterium]|nr:hypothetical protein [Pseudomonadota bacterium]
SNFRQPSTYRVTGIKGISHLYYLLFSYFFVKKLVLLSIGRLFDKIEVKLSSESAPIAGPRLNSPFGKESKTSSGQYWPQ